MTPGRRDRAALVALVAAALALRLAFRITYDEDIDALRFALGVERWSPAELRPHAPFYPVYIASAKLITLLGASPRAALAIVSATAGAALVGFTALLALEVSGRRTAYIAGALALASPFLWLSSEKLMSDVPGAATTTAALWLCAKARRLEAGGQTHQASGLRTTALVTLGVGLGVRLSYFPVAAACLLCVARREGFARATLARAGDLCVGALLWLIPLAAITPARDLITTTWIQAIGHFTRWGGTALTVSSPSERAIGGLWGLWANVLGGAWIDAPSTRWIGAPILVAFAAALILVRRPEGRSLREIARAQPELVASAITYAAWAAVGQNTAYKPRHWLPLAPALIVALATGADALINRARWSVALALILAALWFTDGLALARAHLSPSPAAAIVNHLADGGDDDRRRVLTRDLGQMIAIGAPGRATLRVARDDELLAAVRATGAEGALLTSEALSASAKSSLLTDGYSIRVAFASTRSRYVDSLWSDLALLELKPSAEAPNGSVEP